ncbi:hypothetical protein OHB54_45765 [Streptomyces sp. NBC_01007]|nr:hypothetical protein OHB54_45765 [Streptomyces sp. NBC_01007]
MAAGGSTAAALGAFIVFEDEAGFAMTPPHARTWGRRGQTPVEGIWSLLRRGPMANTAFTDPEHLARTLRRGLARIRRHPELIDGCLTGTGLTLTSDHPKPIRKGQ